MNLSDTQKTFLKKLLLRFLRFSGWVLLPFMLLIAESLFDQTYTVLLYGPAYITRHCIVYGSELGSFLFTNPGEVILHTVKLLLLIGGIIYAAACLTMFALNKAKLFPKIINKDKFLLAALIYSVFALTFSATEFSKVHTAIGKFYAKVRECQTIADYEKLCGKAVLQKTVNENDSEFIKAIAWFENSGFQPGRELHIFQYRKPEVYLLVWSENGKIVHRDWCHQSAAKTSDCGLSDSNDVRLLLIALQNMMNMNGKTQTGSEIELSLNSDFKIIYFHPYTDFDNTKLEESTKQELKEIAFSGEIPRIAVIKSGKVSGYCSVPLPLEPSRKMPMIWTAEHGKIKLKIAKSNNGRWGIF